MLYYKIDVIKELRDRGWTSYSLTQHKICTQGTYVNIKNGRIVGPDVLNRLCEVLEMQPGDILGYKKEEENTSDK